MKALVLAGNRQQFIIWCVGQAVLGIDRSKDAVLVTSREQLVGHENIDFIKTGTWWENDPLLIAEFEFRERIARRRPES